MVFLPRTRTSTEGEAYGDLWRTTTTIIKDFRVKRQEIIRFSRIPKMQIVLMGDALSF